MRGHVLWVTAILAACGGDRPGSVGSAHPRGAPPPTPTTVASAECVEAKLSDSVAQKVFPVALDAFCLDGKEGSTIYGDGGKPLKGICDPFDGECDIYFGYGIDRLVQVKYLPGPGAHGDIEVNLSQFASADQAFAMFTKRTVGDSDPADDAAPKPIEGGGSAALGVGNAYLWRGRYLAELTYVDTKASEQETRGVADKVLPNLVHKLGSALEGDPAVPAPIALLPLEDRLPMGVRLDLNDALGAKGAGPAAFGYHRLADGRRYRTLVVLRADEPAAKTAFATLTAGGKDQPGIADAASLVVKHDGKLDVTWMLARKGTHIFGVGDEARVLRAGVADSEKLCLAAPEKIERLKKIIR